MFAIEIPQVSAFSWELNLGSVLPDTFCGDYAADRIFKGCGKAQHVFVIVCVLPLRMLSCIRIVFLIVLRRGTCLMELRTSDKHRLAVFLIRFKGPLPPYQ